MHIWCLRGTASKQSFHVCCNKQTCPVQRCASLLHFSIWNRGMRYIHTWPHSNYLLVGSIHHRLSPDLSSNRSTYVGSVGCYPNQRSWMTAAWLVYCYLCNYTTHYQDNSEVWVDALRHFLHKENEDLLEIHTSGVNLKPTVTDNLFEIPWDLLCL